MPLPARARAPAARLRRWPLALLGAVLAAALAQAQGGMPEEEPAIHHEVVVQQATAEILFPPDLANLFESNVASEGSGSIFGGNCAGPRIIKDVAAVAFQFREGAQETGCATAVLNLTMPAGYNVLLVNFTADRVVADPAEPAGPVEATPNSLLQYFELRGEGFSRRSDYYDDTAGSLPESVFQQRYFLPEGLAAVTLAWHFEDRGTSASQSLVLPTGKEFSGRVANITLGWPDLPLPTAPVEASPERTVRSDGRDWGVIDYALHVSVPPEYLDPGPALSPDQALRPTTTASLRIAVAQGPTLLNVTGPAGRLERGDYSVTQGDARTTVTIPAETVLRHGAGPYRLDYQSARVLPPAPPPDAPSRIYAFYYAIAFLPLVAAILATHQSTVYVRQAEGPYRRTAWPVFIAVLLVVVYYLLVVGYSFFVLGPRQMATLPLSREAVLVYIQLILLLVMLGAAALAVSRTLIGSMRRDLEERHRKEEQLRRSNEELERFAYVASHDLQEPLRKVAGFTALLQKKYQGRLDKDADEIIQYAVDGATRMQMLIKDILAYSRVGSKELHRVPVDAGSVMELVVSDLGEQIKEAKAAVRWDPLPVVRADASQLRQVLQNLIENAVKYAHPKRRPKVEVSAVVEERNWHFTVQDNGIGIPEDKHEEIFGIFRRLHGPDHPGTGIGLAVAKKAVERHGGRIWVESAPGKGSTFHFTLPRGPLDSPVRWGARPQGSAGPGPSVS